MKKNLTRLIAFLITQTGSIGEVELDKYMDDANLESLGAEDNVGSDTADQSEGESSDSDANQSEESSLEDQLNAVDESGVDADWLSNVNGLGAVRNGLPVEVKDQDELRELIQKGSDYTFKTQEHASTVKEYESRVEQDKAAFETERQEFETYKSGVQEQLTENQIFEQVLVGLQQRDPELFQEISQDYQRLSGQFNMQNPALNQVTAQLNEMKQQLEQSSQFKAQEQNNQIKEGWDSGLKDTQTAYATKLRNLGVKPDWKSVQEKWAADSTGKLSVKEALFAVHGEAIHKGLEAQAKLAKTKAASKQRQGPEGAGGGEGGAAKSTSTGWDMSYLQKLAEKHAG